MQDTPDAHPGYWKACDICDAEYSEPKEHTVQWASIGCCSKPCLQEWQNKQQRY